MQSKGMKVNVNNTKVMIGGESHKGLQNTRRWPCGVCGRGVGRNSIRCTVRNGCTRSVTQCYTLIKVRDSVVYQGCTDQPAGTAMTSVDMGDGASVYMLC